MPFSPLNCRSSKLEQERASRKSRRAENLTRGNIRSGDLNLHITPLHRRPSLVYRLIKLLKKDLKNHQDIVAAMESFQETVYLTTTGHTFANIGLNFVGIWAKFL